MQKTLIQYEFRDRNLLGEVGLRLLETLPEFLLIYYGFHSSQGNMWHEIAVSRFKTLSRQLVFQMLKALLEKEELWRLTQK